MPVKPKAVNATAVPDLAALVARMRAGDRRATARVVTELERLSETVPALLRHLRPYLGHALVVGFTGPPGAGKSTLVNAYTSQLRASGRTVGIVAVDPSSPVSGGAILGDRIRMTATLDDDGVFMRSLASRGHLGGLCPAAVRVIDGLDAAGKDVILLETVGTGQSEIDVAEIADVRVVVMAPGLGDDIQAMKAGLLEIADILVVNKADREGAERTLHQLKSAVGLRPQGSAETALVKTTATTADGVGALAEAVTQAAVRVSIDSKERRRRRARYLIARAAAELLAERIKLGGERSLDALADQVLAGRLLPAAAARKLLAG
ncbi:MAG TPA: methylmalonyl Co-A mutase-associated GTPase MeaB [Hyphomicrobiaceae bacterium]|nr:methylmalonyl Co-A mutase-associated GTPase MeaB [Hyphomicrobiaceae bacterium]